VTSNNPTTDDGFEDDFRVIEATLRANHAPLATLDRLARIRARLEDNAQPMPAGARKITFGHLCGCHYTYVDGSITEQQPCSTYPKCEGGNK